MNKQMIAQILFSSVMGQIENYEKPKDKQAEAGTLTDDDKAMIEKAVKKRARKIQKNIEEEIENTLRSGEFHLIKKKHEKGLQGPITTTDTF